MKQPFNTNPGIHFTYWSFMFTLWPNGCKDVVNGVIFGVDANNVFVFDVDIELVTEAQQI
jgi:hypothetical protein